MEVYKPIPGYPGYEVSNLGNVRSLDRVVVRGNKPLHVRGTKIIPCADYKGYLRLRLQFAGKRYTLRVHRAVAMAFLPNPNNLPQVNHKDGNKKNNCVENLEWCSNAENQRHSYHVLGRVSPSKGRFGAKHWASKQILQLKNGEIIGRFYGTREAARITGIQRNGILRTLKGRAKSAGKCVWVYALNDGGFNDSKT